MVISRTALNVDDTEEYKKKAQIAEKIAREIEGDPTSYKNAELENDDRPEEEKWSEVIRSPHSKAHAPNSSYAGPAGRKENSQSTRFHPSDSDNWRSEKRQSKSNTPRNNPASGPKSAQQSTPPAAASSPRSSQNRSPQTMDARRGNTVKVREDKPIAASSTSPPAFSPEEATRVSDKKVDPEKPRMFSEVLSSDSKSASALDSTPDTPAGDEDKQPDEKDLIKNSKLNPNAKVFTLNPAAKPFTPGPKTTPLSPPHPQQVVQMSPMPQLQAHHMQPQPGMVPMHHGMQRMASPVIVSQTMPPNMFMAPNGPYILNQSHPPHFSGMHRMHHTRQKPERHFAPRPDFTHHNVAAATGHPVLASAPLNTGGIHYPPPNQQGMQPGPQMFQHMYPIQGFNPRIMSPPQHVMTPYGDGVQQIHYSEYSIADA